VCPTIATFTRSTVCRVYRTVLLSSHSTTPTLTPTSSRGFSRGCRRVGRMGEILARKSVSASWNAGFNGGAENDGSGNYGDEDNDRHATTTACRHRNNKQTLFSQKNKDKSNEVTLGSLNMISGWRSIRFTPAFSTPAFFTPAFSAPHPPHIPRSTRP